MTSPLKIGVLIVPPVQLLDVSPIDLFGMLTPEYLRACNMPASVISLGIPVSIHYISLSGPGSIVELTAQAHLQISHGLDSPDVAPGKLDIVMIPGPDPGIVPEKEVLEFVRRHVEAGVTLLTVCTGVMVAGYAGVLDGKRASGPRPLIDMILTKKFKEVKWEDKRWSVDGNIWSSAGITNGQEMVAHYIKQRWPGALSDTVISMADVAGRGQEYDTGKGSDTAWWLWIFMRAIARSPLSLFRKPIGSS